MAITNHKNKGSKTRKLLPSFENGGKVEEELKRVGRTDRREKRGRKFDDVLARAYDEDTTTMRRARDPFRNMFNSAGKAEDQINAAGASARFDSKYRDMIDDRVRYRSGNED